MDVGEDFSHKTIDFCVKIFYMTREVTFRCFFTLKTPKITYMDSGKFFISGGFGVVCWLFGGYGLI